MAEQVMRACNAKPVTVHVKQHVGDREITVVDPEATAAEQLCRDNLTEALQVWCWAEPDRATRLAGRYNRLFNRYRAEQWDGSHLTLPGLAADFTPRPHQKDVVWRILASADRGVLMAHGVGAGKTAAMIIAAQETRRTGRIAGTALFAVPGNMVEQFARDYLRLYPAARVLTPHGATQKDAVREFAARMATGDFDAAICSHNQLKTIPLSPDVEREVLERRLADFTSFDPAETLSRSAARRWARQLEKEQARLAELKKAVEDPAVTYFDRMGVGMLVVDEAHLAKNIRLNTERQGLPMPAGSQRAEAILARTDYVRSRHGDGADRHGHRHPGDQLAGRDVGRRPTRRPPRPRRRRPRPLRRDGRQLPRPRRDRRARRRRQVESRHPARRVQELPRPGPHVPLVRRRAHHRVARLPAPRARRRQSPRARRRPHPATGDGRRLVRRACRPPAHRRRRRDPRPGHRHLGHRPRRRAAPRHHLDRDVQEVRHPRPSGTSRSRWDEPNEKLITAADRIAEIHHRTRDWTYPDSERPGAAQVVFCDAGVPNPDGSPSVYSTLTDLLTERGIARSEIGWVHDIADPNRRQPLWDQVRSGHTRILIGSTMQMGVGVNIQTRLYAAHELTAPYRPDWLEQAEGRLIRQGNHNPTVEVHRYVTERTADANSWQILQRKAHFIAQAMSDPEQMTRDLRDESVATVAEEFATIAAIATGDQRHIELAALTAATTRLERAERAHHASRAAQAPPDRRRRTHHRPAHRPDRRHRHAPPARRRPGRTSDNDCCEMRWNQRTTLQLAGVTYDAHRDRRDPPGDPRHRHLDPHRRRPAAPRRRRTRPRPTDPQPPRPAPRRRAPNGSS